MRPSSPGGLFGFSLGVRHHYGSTARLWLGEQSGYAKAEHLATEALGLFEAEPPQRRHLGYIATARLDLAAAQLGGDDLEGATANIELSNRL